MTAVAWRVGSRKLAPFHMLLDQTASISYDLQFTI